VVNRIVLHNLLIGVLSQSDSFQM